MSPQNVDLTSFVHFDVVFDFYAIVSNRPTVVLDSSSELRLKTKQHKTKTTTTTKKKPFIPQEIETDTNKIEMGRHFFFSSIFFLFKIFPTEL